MTSSQTLTKNSWKQVVKSAFSLFQKVEEKGFGPPPFSLGGGTVLMFRFQHRLSKDIDFFGYDAQWLSLLTPRLNDFAATMATDYVEQANGIKIVMPHGDIDFIISADVIQDIHRQETTLGGRSIQLDPTSEILAKKMFYRASQFKARDVYDLSAAIDLDPSSAHAAVLASKTKSDVLLRRLDDLSKLDEDTILDGIIPLGSTLTHSRRMIQKVHHFIATERDDPNLLKYQEPKPTTVRKSPGQEL